MNKITIDIIKKFKYCFRYSRDIDEVDLSYFINPDGKNKDLDDITWLYCSSEQNYCIIGFDENDIYAMQDEGELVIACRGVENIPYEMLRIAAGYSLEETIEKALSRDKNFAQDLMAYEAWCKENGVELDKERIYHDADGKLFTHYFESYDTE